MFYPAVKSVLFRLQPEKAHDLVLKIAALSPSMGRVTGIKNDSRYAIKVGNCQWSFPVGLAAGLDKNAEALAFFEGQGFGAIECGTITMRPQEGNPRPRMFRYPEEESLRNSMGFPNQGLSEIWPRLRRFEQNVPLGANIGKNKDTGRDESIEELGLLYESLAGLVDYVVVNVSSPNTPGLRAFQERGYLNELFAHINEARKECHRDLYLKIAPDLEPAQVSELLRIAKDNKLEGIIATNTTIDASRGAGGMSGKVLTEKARKIRAQLLRENSGLEIIGVGGISSFQDLKDFWRDGGKVVQVYTSYIYQGPDLLCGMEKDLRSFLEQQQIFSMEEFFQLPVSERQTRLR